MKGWDDDCDKHRYPLGSWFRAHIQDRIQYIILCLLSCKDTMRCYLEYIFISDPVFAYEWATNLFHCKLVRLTN